MDAQGILDLQYETQHFGVHPRLLLDFVYNVFYESVMMALDGLKDYMIIQFKEIQKPHVIQAKIDSILRNIIRSLDKSIDKLEIFSMKNVFSIPKYVLLPEDQIHVSNPCTKAEDEKIDREIEELKKRICEEKAKRYLLLRKMHEQKKAKEYLVSFQEELLKLTEVASCHGVTKESIESFTSNWSKLLNNDVLDYESDL